MRPDFGLSCAVWSLGIADQTVEAVLNYTSQGITYDSGASLGYTYDSGPAFSHDSPFWLASKSNPAIFGTDHKIQSLTGIPGDWSFTTGDYGDEVQTSFLGRVNVRWSKQPDFSSCQGYTKESSGQLFRLGRWLRSMAPSFRCANLADSTGLRSAAAVRPSCRALTFNYRRRVCDEKLLVEPRLPSGSWQRANELFRSIALAVNELIDYVSTPLSVSSVTVTASPFDYAAPRDGFVSIVGGTVSAVAYIRQGASTLWVWFRSFQ